MEIGNDHNTEVTGNSMLKIEGQRTEVVTGNQTSTVTGALTTLVTGMHTTQVLGDAIAKSRDRICTVSRTVALPTPVEMGVVGEL